jgi:hypothetical protein
VGCHDSGTATTAHSPSYHRHRCPCRPRIDDNDKNPRQSRLASQSCHSLSSTRPARAAPTIPWTSVLSTRRITCNVPPAGPRSCRRPNGRRPADGEDHWRGRPAVVIFVFVNLHPKNAIILIVLSPHPHRRPSSSSTSNSPSLSWWRGGGVEL